MAYKINLTIDKRDIWIQFFFAGIGLLSITIFNFPIQEIKYFIVIMSASIILVAVFKNNNDYAKNFALVKLSMFTGASLNNIYSLSASLYYFRTNTVIPDIVILLILIIVITASIKYFKWWKSSFSYIYDLRFNMGLIINLKKNTMSPDIFYDSADFMDQFQGIELKKSNIQPSRIESITGYIAVFSIFSLLFGTFVALPTIYLCESFNSDAFYYYSIFSIFFQLGLLFLFLRSLAFIYSILNKIGEYEWKAGTRLRLGWSDDMVLSCGCGEVLVFDLSKKKTKDTITCPSCGTKTEFDLE